MAAELERLRTALRKTEAERDAYKAQLARYRKALCHALQGTTDRVPAHRDGCVPAMAGACDPLDTRVHDPLAGA